MQLEEANVYPPAVVTSKCDVLSGTKKMTVWSLSLSVAVTVATSVPTVTASDTVSVGFPWMTGLLSFTSVRVILTVSDNQNKKINKRC